MRNRTSLTAQIARTSMFIVFGCAVAGIPALLTACDDTVAHNKSTTTTKVETPNGTTKTTTTSEKKDEETHKP